MSLNAEHSEVIQTIITDVEDDSSGTSGKPCLLVSTVGDVVHLEIVTYSEQYGATQTLTLASLAVGAHTLVATLHSQLEVEEVNAAKRKAYDEEQQRRAHVEAMREVGRVYDESIRRRAEAEAELDDILFATLPTKRPWWKVWA